MRILVTGALGWTAKAIIEALQDEKHIVSGLDLEMDTPYTNPSRLKAMHYTSIENYESVQLAVKNIDMIVHLAVATNGGYETPEIPFNVNVKGTANLFSAALKHGIKRIILISSAPFHVNHPTSIHAINDKLQGTDGDFLYDLTKCLQEDIGTYYANTGQLDVITLRAGHIVDGRLNVDPKGRNLNKIEYGRGAWLCRYDLARAVNRAIAYLFKGYTAFHIIGAQQASVQFDMKRTKDEFGFYPITVFEDYPPK